MTMQTNDSKMNPKKLAEVLAMPAKQLLSELISTPRTSRDEAGAADIVEKMMNAMELQPRRKGNNLWSICPDYTPDRPTLLLNSHIDTVKPVSGWTRDPYCPELTKEGRLYGLGANDAGASLVSLLMVYGKLVKHEGSERSREQLPWNLVFLASCEEEVSGRNGLECVLPELPPIDFAIVGEPTGMQPAIAEKGLMVLDVTATGRSGHAAREEGENAIYKALEAMRWFRDYRFEQVSPLLGAVKMSVTIVNAGTQHNVVPDKCTFTVDVRSNECYTNEELLEEIRRHVTDCEVMPRSTRLGSSHAPMEHPLVQRAIALGRKPFGSPTLSDQALMPFPSMKMGPGESARSHTADEYILTREIEEGIELYLKIMDSEFFSSVQPR